MFNVTMLALIVSMIALGLILLVGAKSLLEGGWSKVRTHGKLIACLFAVYVVTFGYFLVTQPQT